MSRRTLTELEREARVERRRSLREAAAVKVQSLREWREAQSKASLERAREKAIERNTQWRGVDRAPARLRGLAVTVEPHETSKRGRPIDSTLGTYRDHEGNHAQRRAWGQRSEYFKPGKRRRRDMPGAEARRIQRNRKAWSA